MTLHADALAVLRAWAPPTPAQRALRDRYVAHLEQHPDGMARTCLPDHLTASTLVFSADGTRVLLTLHAKSGRWFQFGGHPEAQDQTLADAALREAVEESGLAATDLALVEGWVDEVVGQATAERMPAAAKLQEAVRRRRAAGGPAEQTFSALVGLELRPRRLRDASTLWGSLRTRQGTEARDGVWMHPDLLPTADDLDDPLGFREDAAAPEEMSDEDFEAGLRDLLEPRSGPDDPPAPPAPPA